MEIKLRGVDAISTEGLRGYLLEGLELFTVWRNVLRAPGVEEFNSHIGILPRLGRFSGDESFLLNELVVIRWGSSHLRETVSIVVGRFVGIEVTIRSIGGCRVRLQAGHGGGSASASRNASGRSRTGDEHDVERSRLGREVAEVFKNALGVEEYKLFKSYVHQFDAHEIPFDGPTGIVTLVDRLLVTAPHLGEEGKKRLLDNFVKIILQQA
ncbi:hypothetical protein NLJ89_g74 [Agrocybe chaxingu]|uniref:Uncharacterized protein n=1 Tax=Agrocybe chaxingu TaxID=84603 RepID=A0A9W8N2I4_9AGAR|nr:hypothetical protein NLJ89_g74 [Agrocybe chaxingu]